MKILTTGVGSLPFRDIASTRDYILKHDLIWLPTFPLMDERELMLNEIRLLSQSDSSGQSYQREKSQRWNQLFEGLTFKALKGQLVGPHTFQNYSQSGDRETSEIYREPVLDFYSKIFESFRVQRKILFLDEPHLEDIEGSEIIFRFIELCKKYDFEVGLHSCGEIGGPELEGLDLDYLSFDLARVKKSFFQSSKWSAMKLVAGLDLQTPLDDKLEHFLKEYRFEEFYLSYSCGISSESLVPADILNFLDQKKEDLSKVLSLW